VIFRHFVLFLIIGVLATFWCYKSVFYRFLVIFSYFSSFSHYFTWFRGPNMGFSCLIGPNRAYFHVYNPYFHGFYVIFRVFEWFLVIFTKISLFSCKYDMCNYNVILHNALKTGIKSQITIDVMLWFLCILQNNAYFRFLMWFSSFLVILEYLKCGFTPI